jgi:hypothetical protein
MSEELSTSITFIQNHIPALESGDYRIDVTQTVTANSQSQATYTAQQNFYVSGKRYSLEASDINSVFPPLGSSGQYETGLPHIVLNSSSLPWQRTTGYPYALNSNNKAPWLALLLFDESENIGTPQQVTIANLVTYNQTFFPPRTSEPGEDENAPVNVIDIPLNLFNQICPPIEDLQWLAHVRQVSVANKSTSNDAGANDTYSVVIGNRLPQATRLSTLHLVSLENYSDYLPLTNYTTGAYNTPSANFPVGITMVRLVSLYSWSFRCTPQLQSFGGLLENADMNPPTLQMPFASDTDGTSAANQTVQNAFGMGYTAMNHQVRNGDKTVSWYRGPLLPLGTPPFLIPPYTNADQLMRYDPTLGMLDATYGAAWQLGKLLALHDNGYAQTLVRWKAKQTDDVVQALEETIIDEQFNLPEGESQQVSFKKQSRISFSIKNIVGPAAEKIKSRDKS